MIMAVKWLDINSWQMKQEFEFTLPTRIVRGKRHQ